jgi:sugar/nucleoside kinase (ribokinase family)
VPRLDKRTLTADNEQMTNAVDIVCFSYLAAVQTLYVDAYPPADYGAGVLRRESFLAADGAITAGAAAALGLSPVLLANSLADDAAGRGLLETLGSWGVATAPGIVTGRRETPVSTVICDRSGSRTWFPYLPEVVDELSVADLDLVRVSRMLYVDCYEVLGAASHRALRAAVDAGIPVLANLGGSPAPEWLSVLKRSDAPVLLQTNAAEDIPSAVEETLEELSSLAVADRVVVTAGAGGAVLRAGGRTVGVPAASVTVRRVQGAGSVFSAALAWSLLRGEDAVSSLDFACSAGTLWCAGLRPEPPGLAAIESFRREQNRNA